MPNFSYMTEPFTGLQLIKISWHTVFTTHATEWLGYIRKLWAFIMWKQINPSENQSLSSISFRAWICKCLRSPGIDSVWLGIDSWVLISSSCSTLHQESTPSLPGCRYSILKQHPTHLQLFQCSRSISQQLNFWLNTTVNSTPSISKLQYATC